MVKIYGKYVRPEKKFYLEVNSGEIKVEKAGYRSAKVRIEEIINAGKQLAEARKEQYDYASEKDVPEDAVPDPTRKGNFDLADASAGMQELQKRLRESASNKVKEKPASSNEIAGDVELEKPGKKIPGEAGKSKDEASLIDKNGDLKDI